MKFYRFKSSSVPSSIPSRLFKLSGLALDLGVNALKGSMSAADIERIVNRLCHLRGAVLKFGQMLSLQDNDMIPKQLQEIFLAVQNRAHSMPSEQVQSVLFKQLGSDWQQKFKEFDMQPFAAASIGQVHKATQPDGMPLAVKLQYPGVAESIDSDLSTLRSLLLLGNMLPKGLYLENTLRVARSELALEVDYVREAHFANFFREKLANDSFFSVPRVIDHISTEKVLSMEYVDGLTLAQCTNLPQETRDLIGSKLMELCLMELFTFRAMQTDPNWSNFLYDVNNSKLHLLDFGATKTYNQQFLNDYLNILIAARNNNSKEIRDYSEKLGFLTGLETKTMRDAHIQSVLILGEPFRSKVYDFKDQTITHRIRSLIPLMLQQRLTPPPDDTYSLHRKISGAFLACAKLQSRVRCQDLFDGFVSKKSNLA